MNARSLFVITTAVSSAALGASIAVIAHFHSGIAFIPSQVAQVPSPEVMPPLTVATQATQAEPVLFPPPEAVTEATEAGSPGEFEQLRAQLRRAIRERNSVLLQSLVQAGSLREALSTIAATEQINFENLDASAWTVLEKAIDYRCRQQMTQAGRDGSGCFD